ncbi:lipopolysaccharide transport periplasmic protein LptA [Desulfobulbus alkaliphilus]|uniref:lipopolysaccharide transport periplasmic protein LptA n=1 Tax=Desulfobulbus alkaliphilus TaxID=869814 RepID=UPI001966921E|nr:lipopolysaccharide transport periplasmic protein LptA [Desulfobulbus alkaliphilus]MBM9537703.1 lipopolysaccharide transport periplasmic protein LptA [Desulfobulbus alkaliphilus]
MKTFFPIVQETFGKTIVRTCIFLAIFCIATPVFSEPINIEADRMISQENDNSVVFIGNVDARQGALTIRSDEMTVFYTESTGDGGQQVSSQMEKLICINNVQVIQDDWLGTSDRMDYFANERKVILSGNAKAWQGQNMVSGKTIIYYLDEKRSIVEQDETTQGRVRAVLHPDGN